MKSILFRPLALILLGTLMSCSTVSVVTDYDTSAPFGDYKSYAFFKTGIDKAQISDLDKRRILRAIDSEMMSKGFVKSTNPDLMISIFTTEKERVEVYNNYGWGWGWGPYWGPGYWGPGYWGPGYWGPGYWGPSVSTSTEGALYIDLIDTKKKELVWQGRGQGTLSNTSNVAKKEERIREFVQKIMEAYPPETGGDN
jgi:hypothetical protein